MIAFESHYLVALLKNTVADCTYIFTTVFLCLFLFPLYCFSFIPFMIKTADFVLGHSLAKRIIFVIDEIVEFL